MDSQEGFGSLIPENIKKKLHNGGVQFSELRQAGKTPENLIEAIYRFWRGGSIRVERNWNGILDEAEIIQYSNSACLLPDDRIYLNTSTFRNMWKLATWNVNSIRTRLPLLLEWLEEHNPDVVCLQETKVEDQLFPVLELRQSGYECAFYGQKSYNGVAILSKHPIEDVKTGFRNGYDPDNARLIAGTVSGVRLVNVYVPQGQTTESNKFKYKLNFFAELIQEIQAENYSDRSFAIMGDFNIAPEDRDVHSPEEWEGCVLVSKPERAEFKKLLSDDMSDCFRIYNEKAGHYSWWDYRAASFRRDRGVRIDHIIASKEMTKICRACYIDKNPRKLERPSDPVSYTHLTLPTSDLV